VRRTTQKSAQSKTAPAPSIIPQRTSLAESPYASVSMYDLDNINKKTLASQPPLIQPKLAFGQPSDKYEQEADRMADIVMRMPVRSIQRKPV